MQQKLPTIIALIIVTGFVGGAFVLNRPEDSESTETQKETTNVASPTASPVTSVAPTATGATASPTTASPTAASQSKYNDGSYTATGSYGSPAGNETIEIKLTIKGGVVTAASAVNKAEDRTSKNFQTQFIGSFSSAVVGKNIDELNLGKISGSSLTPKGFNNALASIKQQAS